MAKKDFSQLVAHVEQKQEVKEEATNLDEQLKLLKLAVTHIINSTIELKQVGKDTDELVTALNAAKDSVDNAINGICNAIVEAHQTPVKVEMTDECKVQMKQSHQDLLDKEATLLTNHEGVVNQSMERLETRFKNIVDGFKGVWLDKKTFNIYFWSFFGMLEITIISVIAVINYWVKYGAPWN